MNFHEGLAISVVGWFITCIAGMLPYLIWGGEFNSVPNALFESVSGYTTTGATILNDVEALPKGLLFWRSSTSFIGGVGIVLFVLLILPEKRGAMSSFYRAEVSSLSKMSFTIRSRHILRIIATVYFSLIIPNNFAEGAGMNLFDATCHSLTTVSTSGFSTKNASIAAYDSVWIEMIITFFMLISSMHFGLIYGTMARKKYNLFSSRPTRMYVVVILIGIILIDWQLTIDQIMASGNHSDRRISGVS